MPFKTRTNRKETLTILNPDGSPRSGIQLGEGFPFHYLVSALWFNRIGKAMGETMLELMKDQK